MACRTTRWAWPSPPGSNTGCWPDVPKSHGSSPTVVVLRSLSASMTSGVAPFSRGASPRPPVSPCNALVSRFSHGCLGDAQSKDSGRSESCTCGAMRRITRFCSPSIRGRLTSTPGHNRGTILPTTLWGIGSSPMAVIAYSMSA